MSVGPMEIVIVLILALLVFGPKRLPQMGRSLGKGVREFRKAADTAKTELGLGEVTDQINEVKATFTEPIKEVTGTFSDLKSSVDLKAAVEAPVAGQDAAAAGAALAGAAVVAPDTAASGGDARDDEPEAPEVTPQPASADAGEAPAAPPAADPPTDAAAAVPPETPAAGA